MLAQARAKKEETAKTAVSPSLSLTLAALLSWLVLAALLAALLSWLVLAALLATLLTALMAALLASLVGIVWLVHILLSGLPR
jgi:hypothetical protein